MSGIEKSEVEGELRQEIARVDAWATGVFVALKVVLPPLLRGHPEAETVHVFLQAIEDRHDLLEAHPELAEEDEHPALHEAGKMLNRILASLGVWSAQAPHTGEKS